MPDRLDDVLSNSEGPRHNLVCPKCGDEIKGTTSLGVRLAMKFHRNHTCPMRQRSSKAINLTKQEDGQTIQNMATTVVQNINGPLGQAAGALADAIQFCQQAKAAGEDATNQVAGICGEDDPATQAIVGNTANVSEAVENLVAQIEGAIGGIENAKEIAGSLGWVYNNVGASIMQAGGS